MSARLPFFDLSEEQRLLGAQIKAAIDEVLQSGRFILGPSVEAFETEVAAYLGVPHAVGLNSGTDALVIGLRALNIGPGDEVITTPFTYVATAEAINHVGAKVVFADVDPVTLNLCPEAATRRVTSRTRAIIPVHLFGHPADMTALQELAAARNLALLEDAAQCMGGRYGKQRLGTLGALGAFSFFPTKNLGAYGDGGLIATRDAELAATCRMLRVHGSRQKYHSEELGYNSRLDALQAAILRVKLPHLDDWNAGRREAAARYDALLEGVPGIEVPARNDGHVYHQYTVRIRGHADDRDHLRAELDRAGVPTMVYYPTPLHRQALYAETSKYDCFPHAEQAAAEVLSLPFWPQITASMQETVTSTLLRLHRERSHVS